MIDIDKACGITLEPGYVAVVVDDVPGNYPSGVVFAAGGSTQAAPHRWHGKRIAWLRHAGDLDRPTINGMSTSIGPWFPAPPPTYSRSMLNDVVILRERDVIGVIPPELGDGKMPVPITSEAKK